MSSSALIAEIPVNAKSLGLYEQFGNSVFDEALALADPLRGKKIVHINSTEKGGGVAELLKSQVALERGIGLDSRWLVIHPEPAFFVVTKKMHNLLQGGEGKLEEAELELYITQSALLAKTLSEYAEKESSDLLVVHDPQPLLASRGLSVLKILRLHIDLCEPNESALQWLCQHVGGFNKVIISRQDCVVPCLVPVGVVEIPPAIDPLTVKNSLLKLTEARTLVASFGIDVERPLITQVSRFDQWKDPIGVIEAYTTAKKQVPDVQLALVGFIEAVDDPEAQANVELVKKAAGHEPDIHLFYDPKQLKDTSNDLFINALQVASQVVLQKSLKEGFGLTVTEAMWKGVAVIGGDAGGIRLQIESGTNGLLVHTNEEAAQAIIKLLTKPSYRKKLGEAARKSVQERFLMPRFVRDNLAVYAKTL